MFDLVVKYDDGTEAKVTAGQREAAAWEREKFGCAADQAGERCPTLFARYLAFAALKRTGALPPHPTKGVSFNFDGWDALVDLVEAVEDEDAPVPTPASRPRAASSGSRSPRASRSRKS